MTVVGPDRSESKGGSLPQDGGSFSTLVGGVRTGPRPWESHFSGLSEACRVDEVWVETRLECHPCHFESHWGREDMYRPRV